MLRKMLIITVFVFLFSKQESRASGLDLSSYKDSTVKLSKLPFDNPGFESGASGWILGKGFKIAPGAGRNSTTALYSRHDDSTKRPFARRFLKLTPDKSYKISCWVKANITKKGRYKVGASFYLQFKKGKKSLSYIYPDGLTKSGGWTHIERAFTMPPEADTCVIYLAVHGDYTGEAWFDDLTLESQDRYFVYLAAPGTRTIFTDAPQVEAAAYRTGGKIGENIRILATLQGQEKIAKVVDGSAALKFRNLKPGKAKMTLLLLDTGNKVIRAKEVFTVNIFTSEQRRKKSACWIDRRGRAVVNGRPFLPIGIFTGYCPKEDLDIISDAQFNCVMPYASLSLRFKHKEDKKNSIKKVKEVLDYCDSKNLKVIFSLQNVFKGSSKYAVTQWHGAKGPENVVKKAVNAFKDHPAILAWYANDERPSSMFDKLYARRQLLNELDPYHPAWCVSMHFTELYFFAQTCDVMGIDPYPLNKRSENMYIVEFAGEQARKLKMPYWGVPQIYNMAYYAGGGKNKKLDTWTKVHREPSEEEIRSMTLSMAVNGAKGFVFYHYSCIKDDENRIPVKDYFKKNWPKIKNVVAVLKRIESFLLSDNDMRMLAVKKVQGKIKAAEFINSSGKSCILITAEGPGDAEGIISSSRNFESRFGHTVKGASGKYRFKGKNICSDILFEK